MARRIEFTKKFKKDLNRLRNNKDKLNKVANVIKMLAEGEDIPVSMKPHKLIGNYAGHLELHIEGDLLLIWLEKNRSWGYYYLPCPPWKSFRTFQEVRFRDAGVARVEGRFCSQWSKKIALTSSKPFPSWQRL